MLGFILRLMFPAWVVQGATTPTPGFRPIYVRWLIVALIVLVAALVLLGLVPANDKLVWLAILGLGLALIVP